MAARPPLSRSEILDLLDQLTAAPPPGCAYDDVRRALLAEGEAHVAAIDVLYRTLRSPPPDTPREHAHRNDAIVAAMLRYRRAIVAVRVIQDALPTMDFALMLEAFAQETLPTPGARRPHGGGGRVLH